MLFSVVVALYNKSAYIRETLNAALAQSFTDFEIVVVDDGSTDDSAQIVRSFGDPRIRLVQQANAGVAASRNLGIGLAKGDWIAFLDADDVWSPNYLRAQAHTIAEYSSIDVVSTAYHASNDLAGWVKSSARTSVESGQIELIRDLPFRWLQRFLFFTSSIAVRASTLHAMQPCFAIGESVGEDLDLWFRLGEAGPIAFLPQALVGYRLSVDGNLTSSRPLAVMPPYLLRMQKRAMSGQMTVAQARAVREYVFNDQINVARHCAEVGEWRMALAWVAKTTPLGLVRIRWWITLAMLGAPNALVVRWNNWRLSRDATAIKITKAR